LPTRGRHAKILVLEQGKFSDSVLPVHSFERVDLSIVTGGGP
jgi:hypothetical protein